MIYRDLKSIASANPEDLKLSMDLWLSSNKRHRSFTYVISGNIIAYWSRISKMNGELRELSMMIPLIYFRDYLPNVYLNEGDSWGETPEEMRWSTFGEFHLTDVYSLDNFRRHSHPISEAFKRRRPYLIFRPTLSTKIGRTPLEDHIMECPGSFIGRIADIYRELDRSRSRKLSDFII